MRVKSLVLAGLATLLLAGFSGCGRSPNSSFYTLLPFSSKASEPPAENRINIAISSITLPELVDRPQLVDRGEGSQVEIVEFQRWAEPLKSGIARTLAENISRLTGADMVAVYTQTAASDADWRLFVDIQRFDATADTVSVEAHWTLRGVKNGKSFSGKGRSVKKSAAPGYQGLVSAYSAALATLSNEMAGAIIKAQSDR